MTDKAKEKIKECVGLLNSMVMCGEKHTEQSAKLVREVANLLSETPDPCELSKELNEVRALWEYPHGDNCKCSACEMADLLRKAAAELDRLTAENKELRNSNNFEWQCLDPDCKSKWQTPDIYHKCPNCGCDCELIIKERQI